MGDSEQSSSDTLRFREKHATLREVLKTIRWLGIGVLFLWGVKDLCSQPSEKIESFSKLFSSINITIKIAGLVFGCFIVLFLLFIVFSHIANHKAAKKIAEESKQPTNIDGA